MFASFARALPVELAGGIGEVDAAPASCANDGYAKQVVRDGTVVLMSEPVDLAAIFSFGGFGCNISLRMCLAELSA